MKDPLQDLRSRGRLQDIPADPIAVRHLMTDATRHLRTAELALEDGDLAGAYQLAYDAARKSLSALLLSRGLRARGLGAHSALIEATRAIFSAAEAVDVLRPLDRMRQVRNEAEYSGHPFDHDEVAHDLKVAAAIVAFAAEDLDAPP